MYMKNPVIPYGLIAVLGIIAVIIFSFLGVQNRADITSENNNDNNEPTEISLEDAEEIYQNKCASCHGDDLAGDDNTPGLTEVGSKLSEEEIETIINEGQGNMPAGMATPEEAKILGEWLVEEYN